MYMFSKTAAALLAFSSLVSGYTLNNVTYASNNTEIQLFPGCVQQERDRCPGAWWNQRDPRFLGGVAKMAGDATQNWNFQPPYLAFTFRGSAFYIYQWVNASVANTKVYLDNPNSQLLSFYDKTPGLTDELQLMVTWSAEGLDPLVQHTIGIEHSPDPSRGQTYIILDHILVTETTLEPSDFPKRRISAKTIAGAVVGAVLGVAAIVIGYHFWRRWRRKQHNARLQQRGQGRYEWQADLTAPATIKLDPSSEIEASERIAREGREEEEREKHKLSPLTEHV